MFDEWELVKKYIELPSEVSRLTKYKKHIEHAFYLQNMTTRMDYTDLGIQARAFRTEKMVLEHLMALESIDRRLNRHLLRLRYLDRYVNALAIKERMVLYQCFKNKAFNNLSINLKNSILDEVTEIETMICLREGIAVPEKLERVELSDDFNDNLNTLSDLFAI